MSLLRKFIFESLKDAKELKKINYASLQKQGMQDAPQVIQVKAEDGPIFFRRTLDIITSLDDKLIIEPRKLFIKWLANEIEKNKSNYLSSIKLGTQTFDDFVVALSYIKDYISHPTTPKFPQLLNKSFDELYNDASEWHNTLTANDNITHKNVDENIVYKWNDGFKIVKVDADCLDDEGNAMGHCVASKEKDVLDETLKIFSLRDEKNKSHTTISIDDKGIVKEIKGKQNKVPIEKYARKIKEWLNTTTYDFLECDDYSTILTTEDVKNLIERNVKFSMVRITDDVAKNISIEELLIFILNNLTDMHKIIAKIDYEGNQILLKKIIDACLSTDNDNLINKLISISFYNLNNEQKQKLLTKSDNVKLTLVRMLSTLDELGSIDRFLIQSLRNDKNDNISNKIRTPEEKFDHINPEFFAKLTNDVVTVGESNNEFYIETLHKAVRNEEILIKKRTILPVVGMYLKKLQNNTHAVVFVKYHSKYYELNMQHIENKDELIKAYENGEIQKI